VRVPLLHLPDPASPTLAIAVNVTACVCQLAVTVVQLVRGELNLAMFAAIGAGVSIAAAAWLRMHTDRDRLIKEKLRAEIAGARFMAAISERQHEILDADARRRGFGAEPRH
jgi:hypothetical protein